MWVAVAALITALATIAVSASTFFLTKRAERAAAWKSKKLAYYEEFMAAASGIVGDAPPDVAQIRFANAVNQLHLVGSNSVINALHSFTDEIRVSNMQKSRERHDSLWSRLIWEIRSDLGDPPTNDPEIFKALLWASGSERNA